MNEPITYSVREGQDYPHGVLIKGEHYKEYDYELFHNTLDQYCWELRGSEQGFRLHTNFFVGVNWLTPETEVVSVIPKLIEPGKRADCLKMLSNILLDPHLAEQCSRIYQVFPQGKRIKIAQEDDFLSPLLIFHYVQLLKSIVRKGLMSAYFRVQKNLDSKVKGKVLVGQTIRKNHLTYEFSKVHCSYDEFGVDIPENQFLKTALLYSFRYAREFGTPIEQSDVNYVLSSFQKVSDPHVSGDPQTFRINPLFAEYKEAITIAKLILNRFGYNVNRIERSIEYSTPPFWVDMSKLFELYVLSLLKSTFRDSVDYHFTSKGNELDFLLNTDDYKMVIDAKYKPQYKTGYEIEDIRQIAGYSRLTQVYEKLGVTYPSAIDTLVIYPNQDGVDSFDEIDLRQVNIGGFEGVYKVGIRIPVVEI